jgi:hypothetical protein
VARGAGLLAVAGLPAPAGLTSAGSSYRSPITPGTPPATALMYYYIVQQVPDRRGCGA